MSVFLLPQALCMNINSLMQKFWWSHKSNDSRIHWMSWNRLGLTKNKGGMGFRDFSCFNKALLAKQYWRLWKSPDSLIARILKAKYFPNWEVLDATLGSKPSYAWRSILSSKELLKEGLFWRIGNGEKARIWGDRWVPISNRFTIQSPPSHGYAEAKVSILIDKDLGVWNAQIIGNLFSEEEATTIQSIPLSSTNQEDRLIWRGTANGLFSVKSAYHLAKEVECRHRAECSSGLHKSDVWQRIWRLHVPNVEKNFLWRACHDILPTRENLMRRKIVEDPSCPMCGLDVETPFHILWECPSAMDAWGVSCKKFQKSSFKGAAFIHLMEEVIQHGNDEECKLFAGISRQLWLRRNELIHEGTFLHPTRLVQKVKQNMIEYKDAADKEYNDRDTTRCMEVEKWTVPPVGRLKANWDAAINIKCGKLGMGVVVRDSAGRVKAAKCSISHGGADPTTAEALAAVHALRFCMKLGVQNITMEGDAKSVVDAINSREENWSRFGHIIADVQTLLEDFISWDIKFVGRNANCAAHNMAKLAAQMGIEREWLGEIPDCISEIIRRERSVTSV